MILEFGFKICASRAAAMERNSMRLRACCDDAAGNGSLSFVMRPLPLLSALAATGLFHVLTAAPELQAPPAARELLPGEPSRADLTSARRRLEAWEDGAAEKGARVMRVLYWTPADREPQPEFRPRLTRVMQHIQAFYLREMTAWGFPGRTIRLDLAEDGLLRLPVVKGRPKSAECSEQDSSDGQAIRRDCLRALREAGVDGDKETMVIFCNLAEWDPDKRTMSHHSPYYAGGDSKGGTAWQVDSPLLDSAHLAVKDQHLRDRQYGFISLGRYNSIFVGGVCHELGHALGLPHCRESEADRASRGTALMGSGNRTYGEELRGEGHGSFLTLAHALKLAAHPQFSGSVKEKAVPLTAVFTDWKLTAGAEGLRASAKVQTNLPCHAVLAYGDPAGGGDYDAAIAAAVPGEDGSFSLLLPRGGAKKKSATLSFVAVGVKGAATAGVWSSAALTLALRIDEQGNYDAAPALATLQVEQHAAAARAGKLEAAVLTGLAPAAREALRRLALPDSAQGKPSPADVPATTASVPLSDTAPAAARTGYGGVHYDRSDAGAPLTGPDGPAAHGLWAHANATHTYTLGGKWKTFTGSCALLKTGSGPVKAIILADGKPLWESQVIEPGKVGTFRLDVTGVQTLTLETKGTRGIGSAHSAWLEPVLGR